MDAGTFWTIILTVLAAVFTIIGVNIGLLSWIRSDLSASETRMETKIGALDTRIGGLETKIDSFISEVRHEMKDFHGRLCSLEARYHDERFKHPKTDP